MNEYEIIDLCYLHHNQTQKKSKEEKSTRRDIHITLPTPSGRRRRKIYRFFSHINFIEIIKLDHYKHPWPLRVKQG